MAAPVTPVAGAVPTVVALPRVAGPVIGACPASLVGAGPPPAASSPTTAVPPAGASIAVPPADEASAGEAMGRGREAPPIGGSALAASAPRVGVAGSSAAALAAGTPGAGLMAGAGVSGSAPVTGSVALVSVEPVGSSPCTRAGSSAAARLPGVPARPYGSSAGSAAGAGVWPVTAGCWLAAVVSLSAWSGAPPARSATPVVAAVPWPRVVLTRDGGVGAGREMAGGAALAVGVDAANPPPSGLVSGTGARVAVIGVCLGLAAAACGSSPGGGSACWRARHSWPMR